VNVFRKAPVVIGAAHVSQTVVLDRRRASQRALRLRDRGESIRIIADIPCVIFEMKDRLLLCGCAQISFAHYQSSSVGRIGKAWPLYGRRQTYSVPKAPTERANLRCALSQFPSGAACPQPSS
jgi:hypothetical protein